MIQHINCDKWLRKVQRSFIVADPTALRGPEDPTVVDESSAKHPLRYGSTSTLVSLNDVESNRTDRLYREPGSPRTSAPDDLLNQLSIYRLVRRAVPQKHAPEPVVAASSSSASARWLNSPAMLTADTPSTAHQIMTETVSPMPLTGDFGVGMGQDWNVTSEIWEFPPLDFEVVQGFSG